VLKTVLYLYVHQVINQYSRMLKYIQYYEKFHLCLVGFVTDQYGRSLKVAGSIPDVIVFFN
jgi:hypothetical protein